MMGEQGELIVKQLDNINTGIMLLHAQFTYAEAFKNGIISKADYRNYLRDTIKVLKETNERLVNKNACRKAD